MIKKLVMWFNKTFRGWKYRTLGDCEDEYKYLGKKELIKRIVLITGKINENPGVIDKAYEEELRGKGKKTLIKCLLLLHIAYTKKIQKVE